MDSLRNETVVDTDSAVTTFPIQPAGLRKSIERALRAEDYQFAQKRWSTELVAQRPGPAVAVRVNGRVVSTRAVRVSRPAADAFAAIQRMEAAQGGTRRTGSGEREAGLTASAAAWAAAWPTPSHPPARRRRDRLLARRAL